MSWFMTTEDQLEWALDFLRDALAHRERERWCFRFASKPTTAAARGGGAGGGGGNRAPRVVAGEWKDFDSPEVFEEMVRAMQEEDGRLAPIFMRVSIPKYPLPNLIRTGWDLYYMGSAADTSKNDDRLPRFWRANASAACSTPRPPTERKLHRCIISALCMARNANTVCGDAI